MNKNNWTYKTLGEVATFSRGLTYSKKDVAEDTSKKVLRSNNIDLATNSLNYEDIAYLKEDFVIPEDKILHKNDIFICMSNGSTKHLGKVAFIETETDYAFGGFMGAIHPITSEVFPKFAFYFCLSSEYRRSLATVLNGININNIQWSDLSKFLIPIPPLAEQERIVAELDLLSSIIEKKKAQLKELDQLAQSIFYDMFGDPITNEKGWEVKTIGDTCNITCGQDYKSVKDDNGQYPIYGTGGIMGWANQYRCPKHSVIIGRKGNINNPILVDVDFWNVDTAFGITPKNEELKVVYFFFFCKEYDFTKHDVSVTIPSLRRIDVLKIKLPLPPLPLQQEFADKVEAIERQKSLIQQSIDEVQTLFDSRMDYWFG